MERYQEEKLLDFYRNLVTVSQKDISSSIVFFEESILSMLLGYEAGMEPLRNAKIYEMLLMKHILHNDCTENEFFSSFNIFTSVDSSYYYGILNKYFIESPTIFIELELIGRLATDLDQDASSMATELVRKARPNLYSTFKEFLKLKEIMRTGWIKRNVNSDYYESDSTHTMQMFAFASAYFRIYQPKNLDFNKVMEMILIHELGEVLAGDIPEGDKNHGTKHQIEEKCIRNVLGGLKSGAYFINLWLEFEERQTEEAKFVYMVDKLDPVLKADFLDDELNRNDLFDDFFNYEEKRGTFQGTDLESLFRILKEQHQKKKTIQYRKNYED